MVERYVTTCAGSSQRAIADLLEDRQHGVDQQPQRIVVLAACNEDLGDLAPGDRRGSYIADPLEHRQCLDHGCGAAGGDPEGSHCYEIEHGPRGISWRSTAHTLVVADEGVSNPIDERAQVRSCEPAG